jgi:hypothetical protein
MLQTNDYLNGISPTSDQLDKPIGQKQWSQVAAAILQAAKDNWI